MCLVINDTNAQYKEPNYWKTLLLQPAPLNLPPSKSSKAAYQIKHQLYHNTQVYTQHLIYKLTLHSQLSTGDTVKQN